MTKAQQKAFNKALLDTVKNSKDRKLIPDPNTGSYIVMVPVATVLKNFKKFTKQVNKDLGVSPKTKKGRVK